MEIELFFFFVKIHFSTGKKFKNIFFACKIFCVMLTCSETECKQSIKRNSMTCWHAGNRHQILSIFKRFFTLMKIAGNFFPFCLRSILIFLLPRAPSRSKVNKSPDFLARKKIIIGKKKLQLGCDDNEEPKWH